MFNFFFLFLVIMIDSDEPIHRIKNIKKISKKIISLYQEYTDKTRYMSWSRKKRKFILKKYKRKW